MASEGKRIGTERKKGQEDTIIPIFPWIKNAVIQTPPEGIDIGFRVPAEEGDLVITARYSVKSEKRALEITLEDSRKCTLEAQGALMKCCKDKNEIEQEKKALEESVCFWTEQVEEAVRQVEVSGSLYRRMSQKNKALMKLLKGLYRQEYPGDKKFFDADFKRYVNRGLPDYKGIKDEK